MTEQQTFVTTDEAFRNTQGFSWIFLCGGGGLAYFVCPEGHDPFIVYQTLRTLKEAWEQRGSRIC